MIVSCRFYIEKALAVCIGHQERVDMRSRQNFLHLYIGEEKEDHVCRRHGDKSCRMELVGLFCQFLKSADTGELMIMKGLKDRITLFRPAMRHKGFYGIRLLSNWRKPEPILSRV